MNYQYAIIGNGRVATHMLHYFKMLGIPHTHWHRKSTHSIKDVVAPATHVLLLVSDSAIDAVATENADLFSGKKVVHFSGAHNSPHVFSAHPLMTFCHELYAAEVYPTIPFVVTHEEPEFATLLPGLLNAHYIIHASEKPYYHALAVMGCNFSTILWEKMIFELSNRYHIPKQAVMPIMRQTFANLEKSSEPLAGPLSRKDTRTIADNLEALKADPFREVYQGFVKAYAQEGDKL